VKFPGYPRFLRGFWEDLRFGKSNKAKGKGSKVKVERHCLLGLRRASGRWRWSLVAFFFHLAAEAALDREVENPAQGWYIP
jgi:hypothetical protein